jgi:hypothetical protein
MRNKFYVYHAAECICGSRVPSHSCGRVLRNKRYGRIDQQWSGPAHELDDYRSGRSETGAGQPPGVSIPAPSTPATLGPGVQDSKFREINRDSGLFGRLPIGQRIRINSQGEFSPDPSPEDETSNPLATLGPSAPGQSTQGPFYWTGAPASPRNVPLPPSPEDATEALPQFQPGPERRTQVHAPATAAAVVSERPSEEPSALGHLYHDIRAYRSLFKGLNDEIAAEQRKSRGQAAKGEDVLGWVLVGRGVRWLPGA